VLGLARLTGQIRLIAGAGAPTVQLGDHSEAAIARIRHSRKRTACHPDPHDHHGLHAGDIEKITKKLDLAGALADLGRAARNLKQDLSAPDDGAPCFA